MIVEEEEEEGKRGDGERGKRRRHRGVSEGKVDEGRTCVEEEEGRDQGTDRREGKAKKSMDDTISRQIIIILNA